MEIGDIGRFTGPGKLCSYVGLVPGLHQLGEKRVYGRITKQGNKWIRCIIVEAVGHVARSDEGEIAGLYRRLKARRGASVAKVACARKLLRVVWYMLTRDEPYRYHVPGAVERKLRRLERRADEIK